MNVGVGDTLDGVYLLEEEVGRGSMGVVYRAVDTVRRVTVAVKVMKADAATDSRFRRLFRREARAMARLNHPGVIQIYGYGVTPGDRPYLVMEWAKGCALHQLGAAPSSLSFVVTLVDRVLEALAHAHARGVIHRDLKPANILLMAPGGDAGSLSRGSVKLVDFGIARVFDVLTSRSDPKRLSFAQLAKRGFNPETRPYEVRLEGTPRYIAPELYRGQEGLISPANDIYAVGVILYEFLSGRPVFDADSEAVLMALQIRGDIPLCRPRPELGPLEPPQKLLEAMLAPDPLTRMDHATEVRRLLMDWFRSQRGSADDTVRFGSDPDLDAAVQDALWGTDDPFNETRSAPSETLAASEPEINLLSWRPMPVYGRAREQAWLWQHIEQLSPSSGASVCVLEGDPGIGKTHLARWLVEIGYEAGGVCPLWCGLSSASTLDALRALLDRHFHTVGLDPKPVEKRLQQFLAHQAGTGAPFVVPIQHEQSRLSELLRPRKHNSPDPMRRGTTTTLSGNLGAVAFDVSEELAALASRVFERAGAVRPVLIVFDGMESQHAEGVFRLVDHIMRSNRARPFPVLIVITAVRGVIDSLTGQARNALDYLVGTERLTRLALDPIPNSEMLALLLRYDSLSPQERVGIIERSEGNPLFALELAGHALRVDPTASGSEQALSTPEGIRDLWRRRVAIIASRCRIGTVAIRVLELAAVLGSPLWLDLLNTAWQSPDLETYRHSSDDVLAAWDVWIDADVLVEDPSGGVYFRHAMLRDTLLADMGDDARARDFHGAAARARRQLDLARTPADWLRLADHLCAAAKPTDAWPFALGAAQHLLLAGELDAAKRAFALCDGILVATGGDDDDPRREHVDVGVAQLSWRLGDRAEAERRAKDLCARAQRTGSMRQLGRGELLLAELALHGAATDSASELFDRALGRFETCADNPGLADCYAGIGRLALRGGRADVARRNLRQAEQMMVAEGNHEGVGQVQLLLAETCQADGNLQAAERHLSAARVAFERAGNPLGEARAVSELGHIAQAKGEMAAAESMFQVYLEKAESMGDIPAAAQARANLAHARLRLGQHESAVELLAQARQATADLNDRTSLAIIESILTQALARLDRWPEAIEVLASSLGTIRDLEIYDIDVAESLELAADAEGARDGLGPMFVVLIEEAARQWRNLGNIERAHAFLARHSGR